MMTTAPIVPHHFATPLNYIFAFTALTRSTFCALKPCPFGVVLCGIDMNFTTSASLLEPEDMTLYCIFRVILSISFSIISSWSWMGWHHLVSCSKITVLLL